MFSMFETASYMRTTLAERLIAATCETQGIRP